MKRSFLASVKFSSWATWLINLTFPYLPTDYELISRATSSKEANTCWLADTLEEIKTICHCGRKATMVLRTDSDGNVVRDGNQVKIGGNELYISVCPQALSF